MEHSTASAKPVPASPAGGRAAAGGPSPPHIHGRSKHKHVQPTRGSIAASSDTPGAQSHRTPPGTHDSAHSSQGSGSSQQTPTGGGDVEQDVVTAHSGSTSGSAARSYERGAAASGVGGAGRHEQPRVGHCSDGDAVIAAVEDCSTPASAAFAPPAPGQAPTPPQPQRARSSHDGAWPGGLGVATTPRWDGTLPCFGYEFSSRQHPFPDMESLRPANAVFLFGFGFKSSRPQKGKWDAQCLGDDGNTTGAPAAKHHRQTPPWGVVFDESKVEWPFRLGPLDAVAAADGGSNGDAPPLDHEAVDDSVWGGSRKARVDTGFAGPDSGDVEADGGAGEVSPGAVDAGEDVSQAASVAAAPSPSPRVSPPPDTPPAASARAPGALQTASHARGQPPAAGSIVSHRDTPVWGTAFDRCPPVWLDWRAGEGPFVASPTATTAGGTAPAQDGPAAGGGSGGAASAAAASGGSVGGGTHHKRRRVSPTNIDGGSTGSASPLHRDAVEADPRDAGAGTVCESALAAAPPTAAANPPAATAHAKQSVSETRERPPPKGWVLRHKDMPAWGTTFDRCRMVWDGEEDDGPFAADAGAAPAAQSRPAVGGSGSGSGSGRGRCGVGVAAGAADDGAVVGGPTHHKRRRPSPVFLPPEAPVQSQVLARLPRHSDREWVRTDGRWGYMFPTPPTFEARDFERNVGPAPLGADAIEQYKLEWIRRVRPDSEEPADDDQEDSDDHDSVCGDCGEGGMLLCCDTCPAAFHLQCLGLAVPPQGEWTCPDCGLIDDTELQQEDIDQYFAMFGGLRATAPAANPLVAASTQDPHSRGNLTSSHGQDGAQTAKLKSFLRQGQDAFEQVTR